MLLDSSWQAPRDTCDATPCRVEYELHAVRYEVDAADVADIPFEHCDPVRAFPAWPGKRHYSGLLWLESLGKHVGFESFTERTCLMELDRDPEVTAVSSQPMWIRWGDGSPRGHVPDYFARLRDGRAAVIDVRPLQLIDDDARRQFDRTAAFCRDRDWQYAVFAPDTQVRDANLRFLLRYRAAQWRMAVPAQCTAKALLQEFARFFALPTLTRMTYGALLDMVANAMRRCGTELVLIDDVHHLDLRYRQNVEASDMLKQLSERCGGTFVYAGIAVEATGLLSGTREGRLRKRFELHTAGPFKISSKQGQSDWGDLLLAVEDSLCLLQQRPGAILAAAKALHRLTNGEIGLLKDLLQLAAYRAIEDGSEELDLAEFEHEVERRQANKQSARL